MYCILIISRYPKWFGVFGFLSMMIFRLPLSFSKKIKFWKLMGSGRNGTFDVRPDFNQWAVLFTVDSRLSTVDCLRPSEFIDNWLSFFHCKNKIYILNPIEGHGLWDGKEVFGHLPKQSSYEGSTRPRVRPYPSDEVPIATRPSRTKGRRGPASSRP